jgi:hypothetical protein
MSGLGCERGVDKGGEGKRVDCIKYQGIDEDGLAGFF